MKNLFNYATKELSQDAFLRWLFENYNCENENVRLCCKALFNKFTNDNLDFYKIEELTTVAQWKNIDVSIWFTIENKQYLIVIEDKTTSEEHSSQLEEYAKKIEEHNNWLIAKNKPKIEEVYKVFYKTAEISKEEVDRIEKAGWKNIVSIKEIYELFKDVKDTKSEILDGYADHIREINDTYYNFENIPFNEWLYNNTIFLAYAQKKIKVDFAGCYNGIYVYAGKQKKFNKFTVEVLFEFRHWEISAKIQYFQNENQFYDIYKLRDFMRKIDLSDCKPFPTNSYYGNKRLAKIIINSENPKCKPMFKTYKDFDTWVCCCIDAFEKFANKINEEEFEKTLS